MKNKVWFGIFSVVSISLMFIQEVPTQSSKKVIPSVRFGLPFAFGGASANCETIIQGAVAGEPARDTYLDDALDHVHRQLYRFNQMESADIEMVFCRLVNRLGMDPDLTQLPQNLSRTKDGQTTTLDVTVPSEQWAIDLGYSAKAVVSYNSVPFLGLWWDGKSESSKGFLIQSANPMHSDGEKHLKYAQWDRTSESQLLKIYSAVFQSSFLGDASHQNPNDSSKPGGDRAHYARASFNSSTKEVRAQSIEIRQDKDNHSVFKCVKTQFEGIIGGKMAAYRPALGTPASVTDTNVNGQGLDGATNIEDNPATAKGSGTRVSNPTLTENFDYSCNDINNGSASGKPFANGEVNFNLSPAEIFPH